MSFRRLRGNTTRRLTAAITSIRDIAQPETDSWEISAKQLKSEKEPAILDEIDEWAPKGSKYLYVISVADGADLARLKEKFLNAKKNKVADRAYARCNNRLYPALYAGSSASLRNRISQHLGYGAKGTYALQLRYWMPKNDLKVMIECACYDPPPSQRDLQELEDTLWDDVRPMFGRKGGR